MTNPVTNQNDVNQLLEMGFPENRAVKALAVTGNQGPQVAMDWIFAHMDDPDIDVPYQPPQGNVLGKSDVDLPKPDLVLNPENAERELAKPLTAEEKAEQLRRVQERMALKKKEREELEKKDLIEREKKRREYGKEATVQKQKFEQLEREKIANELKRQKEEDRIARERVREQIAADKAARGAKFARTSGSPAACTSCCKHILHICRYCIHRCKKGIHLRPSSNSLSRWNQFGGDV